VLTTLSAALPALQTVHSPLEVPASYTSRAPCAAIGHPARRTFCGMALAADDVIGNTTRAMKRLFPGEDYLLVVSGDNGGHAVCSAAGAGGGGCGNNLPFRGQKGDLFEGGVRFHPSSPLRPFAPSPLRPCCLMSAACCSLDPRPLTRSHSLVLLL
jgi:hypothetical protein